MNNELLEKAKQNCINRAEGLLRGEVAQVHAKFQSRLNPSETLVSLEAFKLALEDSKTAFASSEDERGLEIFSSVHDQLKRLCWKLLH